MSEPNHPRTTRHRWAVTLAVLFGLFILWPLSAGPLIWLEANGHIDPAATKWIWNAYLPWQWLSENSTLAEAFFVWYVDQWVPSHAP